LWRNLALLASWWRGALASAYELSEDEVAADAAHLQEWVGSDGDLIGLLETRHGWTAASELGPYYLASMRRALI
jgi:hypothetical protein